MEAPLGTSRFARLLESYRLATKQPPPPGLVLVHNQLSGPPLRQGKSFRAWWAKPAAEIVPPTLVTITASTDPARSFGAPRDAGDQLTDRFRPVDSPDVFMIGPNCRLMLTAASGRLTPLWIAPRSAWIFAGVATRAAFAMCIGY
jgi:hypothetical protein